MSDRFEFEELVKSLDVTPNESAKDKARAAFMDKAEEVAATAKEVRAKKSKRKSRRHAVLYFAAGMAAMLIMFVGVRAAYSPAFLTGTIAGEDQIYYRVFPVESDTPELDTSLAYTGELVLLPKPGAGQAYTGNFIVCDGENLAMSDHMSLLSVISGRFGLDWTARTFQIPNYATEAVAENFQYCMITEGAYPYANTDSQVISDSKFQYVAADFSVYAASGENPENRYGFYLGELLLLKLSDGNAIKTDLLPCEGQTLKTADYPGLAMVLGVTGDTFTLPDFSGSSPVAGAVYYISLGGEVPFESMN